MMKVECIPGIMYTTPLLKLHFRINSIHQANTAIVQSTSLPPSPFLPLSLSPCLCFFVIILARFWTQCFGSVCNIAFGCLLSWQIILDSPPTMCGGLKPLFSIYVLTHFDLGGRCNHGEHFSPVIAQICCCCCCCWTNTAAGDLKVSIGG